VMHAEPLRGYLSRQCDRIAIIDPTEIWFEDTLQGAVILLAEKCAEPGRAKGRLAVVPVAGRDFTRLPAEELLEGARWHNAQTIEGKWTRAAVPSAVSEILAGIRERHDVVKLGTIADVDVGIVTGANKFFLVTDDVVRMHDLHAWAHPMFGRSEHCPGIIYDEEQHAANAQSGFPTNFLWFNPDNGRKLHRKALEYIASGERDELHERYKCRIREPWYEVPSVYSTPLGMLKRSHDAPRLIVNSANALTTDTAYRLTAFEHSPELLATSFLTALTALSAEIEGRYYGGGVLELVPSEIERLLVCVPARFRPNVGALDRLVRTTGLQDAIEQQTTRVLGSAGFSTADCDTLLDGWHHTRNRRQRVEAAER